MEKPKEFEISIKVDMTADVTNDELGCIVVHATPKVASAMFVEIVNTLYRGEVLTKDEMLEAIKIGANDQYAEVKKVLDPLALAVYMQRNMWESEETVS